jgi:putative nucleotidyltransferase with HDIG domain
MLHMPSILIVDDDQFLRSALKITLEKQRYTVVEAPDGRSARTIISAGNFDLIISDIQMPHLTGIELLQWIILHKPIPVILTTGFSNLLETQKAHELGAAGFLTKPFKDADLFERINKILKKNEPSETPKASHDDEYCKVSIEDFIMGKQISFSVFIRLSPTKYIKVAHKGENIDLEQIKAYKSKGLNFLYVKRDEYAQLVGFNLKLAKAIQKTSTIDPEKRKAFLKYTGEVVLEQAFTAGLDKAAFDSAKDYLDTSMAVLSEDEGSFGLLMSLSSHSDYQYAHAIGVSTVSVMIARKMGWSTPGNLFRIGLAGLFHDIGKREIPKEITERPRHLLSTEERALLESHVTRGKDILENLQVIPQDVIQVAYEHHENCLAQGFPRRLARERIHPYARLIFLSDLFCNYTIRSPSREPISPAAAIKKIEDFHTEEVDLDLFQALKSLQKV